ncbi:MAG: M20/M25/M40 family metallo-hydrolase [Myxococcales bacterium]|nr:M20/M25/M40 family metallo-hydrolase [Myxococcales bacterium]
MRRSSTTIAALLAILIASVLFNGFRGGPRPEPAPPLTPPPLDAKALAARLAASLRIPTVSLGAEVPTDPAPFLKLHDLLEASFPLTHSALRREVIAGASLLYHWPGSDPDLAPFLLMGHLDVVPVEPGTEDQWVQPPFSGFVDGDFVWGRGALDDKVSVLAALEATEHLLQSGFEPKRGLYLAFGHDEEEGGNEGAKVIAETLAARGESLQFTLDEGSGIVGAGLLPGLLRDIAVIATAEKGYLTLELIARAPGGHSSTPPPRTSIGSLARALRRLAAQPVPEVSDGPAGALLDHLEAHVTWPLRLILRNRWLFDPVVRAAMRSQAPTAAMLHTTTAPTMLRAGIKDNVLPSEARATVNFRVIPGDTVEGVVAHVRRAIADPDIEIEVIEGREPTPPQGADTAGFRVVSRVARGVFPGLASAPGLTIAGTDSKHYVDVADTNLRFLPLRLTATDVERIHGTNERISIEVYLDAVGFFVELVRAAASE